MTKDDSALIETWIRYHGNLIGYDNLHILDNSTDTRIKNFYKQTSHLGYHLHIYPECNLNTAESFINGIKNRVKHTCNFVTKFDTDEFLVVHDNGKYICNPEILNQEINQLDTGTNHYFYNSLPFYDSLKPTLASTYFAPPEVHTNTDYKQIFTTKYEQQVDLGCHGSRDIVGNNKKLTIIHYHRQDFQTQISNLKKVCISHGWITDQDDKQQILNKLPNVSSTVSSHKREALLRYISGEVTENQYNLEHQNRRCTLHFEGIYNVHKNLT